MENIFTIEQSLPKVESVAPANITEWAFKLSNRSDLDRFFEIMKKHNDTGISLGGVLQNNDQYYIFAYTSEDREDTRKFLQQNLPRGEYFIPRENRMNWDDASVAWYRTTDRVSADQIWGAIGGSVH